MASASIAESATTIIFDNTGSKAATINLPSGSTSLSGATRGYWFTTGAAGFTVTSVTGGLFGNSAGTALVGLKLYQGSNTSGTLLETIAQTSFTLATLPGGTYRSWESLAWELAANTAYAVAFTYAAGDVTPRMGTSTETPVVNSAITAGGFFAGDSPVVDNIYSVQITGSISAVPEPTSVPSLK